MNFANASIAWDDQSQNFPRASYGETIWNALIVWLAGFLLTASAFFVGVGCTGNVIQMPYPSDGGVVEAGSPPPTGPEFLAPPVAPRCRRFDYPVYCNPFFDGSRDFGDPAR